ncbi:MAG: hypothetical protein ACTII7_07245 [Galactobacter sp.]
MTTTRTAPKDQAMARYRWIALWIPLALAVLVAAIQATVIDDLTATVGTHFTWDGTADGWGPAWTYPAMSLGTIGGLAVLLWGIGLLSVKGIGTQGKPVRLRFMAAIGLGSAVFLAVTVGAAGGTWVKEFMIFGLMLIAAVVGIGIGWIGYRLAYDIEAVGEEAAQPQPVALNPSERAVWTGRTSMGKAGLWLTVGSIVVMVGCTFAAAAAEVSADGGIGWITWTMAGFTVLMAALLPAFTSARIRVDAAGLRVASPVGWPKTKVPLDQIDTVEVTDVNPMGEFGGWGWRWVPGGGWGVVMRVGEGLRVTRIDGKSLTVTVDEAAEAAALLEGLRARS